MSGPASRPPSRREVLAGGGVLALAGCLPGDETAPEPPPDPELRVREGVATEVAGLGAAYAAVVERFPDAGAELTPLAAEHGRHAAALRGPEPPASPAPSPTAASASPPTAATGPPPTSLVVPGTLAQARTALADMETAAARRRAGQARDVSPALARLLASIAACEAAHAALLRDAGAGS